MNLFDTVVQLLNVSTPPRGHSGAVRKADHTEPCERLVHESRKHRSVS